ncbi:MAG: formylglycine-generating enzyme family protein [Chloroflexota bacterium]|nr:formylglycine-generating enzyme family protein [Chloroflexota bacterium]
MRICRTTSILLILLLTLSACASEAPPTPTLAPTSAPVAANADWTPVFETFDGVEMALVAAGCMNMGHEDGRRDERPEHKQCFERPFWIGRTEITNAQYGSEGPFPGETVARTNITWVEARDFCASKSMRLPTEAEWEYAARGPDSLLYPWGNELIDANVIFDRNSNNQVIPVGSRPDGASWVGALDMIGNAMEWTSSLYQRYPYDASDGREDLTDTTSPRVYRSSISSYIDFAASAPIRFRDVPDFRDWFLGFRCARSADN